MRCVPLFFPPLTTDVLPDLEFFNKHGLVMSIPLALKTLLGIVFPFQSQKIDELWIRRDDLLAGSPAMICGEIATVVVDCDSYQPSRILGRFFDPSFRVIDMQVA